jgi:serine/threonine protein kinase
MIIANKYKILEEIGKGAFGKVYKGENIRTKELVAIKVEKVNGDIKSLKYETQIYQAITSGQKTTGFVQVKWFGLIKDYYFMVLPLLGNTLGQFKRAYLDGGKLPLNMVLYFGKEMVTRLQHIHEKGFIHRDVKPDNFLFDLIQDKEITIKNMYLLDFGFCKQYVLPNGNHIPMKTNKQLIGTPNYVSINMHNGIEPSRRDDLESVGYIMINLFYRDEEIKMTNMTEIIAFKFNIISTDSPEQEKKLRFPLVPQIIKDYLNYCKHLKFEQTPDYDYLYTMLRLTIK